MRHHNGYTSLHVLRPLVSDGVSHGGELSVALRDSVLCRRRLLVRRHPLVDKFVRRIEFELQLIRVGLPPSAVHAVFNIYLPTTVDTTAVSIRRRFRR